MTQSKQPLQLYIICLAPPPTAFKGLPASLFGLQDKKGALDLGNVQADGSRLFTCTIEAKLLNDDVDFSGAYVQGTKVARFIYLSWKQDVGGWVQRIKIPLVGITPEQVIAHRPLEALIENGRASGTVKPLQGWKTV